MNNIITNGIIVKEEAIVQMGDVDGAYYAKSTDVSSDTDEMAIISLSGGNE